MENRLFISLYTNCWAHHPPAYMVSKVRLAIGPVPNGAGRSGNFSKTRKRVREVYYNSCLLKMFWQNNVTDMLLQ